MKSISLYIILFVLLKLPLAAQTHYIFFYAYKDGESYDDYYSEVAVTKIYKDTAAVHYYFKLLNLKQLAFSDMEKDLPGYEAFNKINGDFSATEEEAKAKRDKLKEIWVRKNTEIHELDFFYKCATGQEYPQN